MEYLIDKEWFGTTTFVTTRSPTDIASFGTYTYTYTDFETVPKLLDKAELNKIKRIEREKLNSKSRKNSRWC